MAKTHKVHTQPAPETVIKPWTYNDEQRQMIEQLREVCDYCFDQAKT